MRGESGEESFEVRTGTAHGRLSAVWLVLDGTSFPEAGWTDFPLVLINWWAEATLRLLRSQADVVEWRFMEGPFWAEIGARGPDNVRFMRQTRAGPRVIHVGTVRISRLAEQLARAIEHIPASLSQASEGSSEIATLRAMGMQLQTARRILPESAHDSEA